MSAFGVDTGSQTTLPLIIGVIYIYGMQSRSVFAIPGFRIELA